jgi:hypothetical protein
MTLNENKYIMFARGSSPLSMSVGPWTCKYLTLVRASSIFFLRLSHALPATCAVMLASGYSSSLLLKPYDTPILFVSAVSRPPTVQWYLPSYRLPCTAFLTPRHIPTIPPIVQHKKRREGKGHSILLFTLFLSAYMTEK